MSDSLVLSKHPENYGRGTSGKSRRERRRRQELFDAQQGCCYWCGGKMQMNPLRPSNGPSGKLKSNEAYATFEHLIPKSKNGSRGFDNIVLAHAACNHKRAKLKWAHDPVYGKAVGSRMKTAHSLPFVNVEDS